MNLNFEYSGKSYVGWSFETAVSAGVPHGIIGGALKVAAKAEMTFQAENYRRKLASSSAGKLAEYRIKEEIARDPSVADQAELDLLAREADARGTDLAGLLAQINAQAVAFRKVALLVGVLEAEVGAAIAAIADDAPDIEAQIQTVLGAAKMQAETAFNEALALIAGS